MYSFQSSGASDYRTIETIHRGVTSIWNDAKGSVSYNRASQVRCKGYDKARLERLYVTVDKDGKKTLIKPEQQARFLGIDEFKLHDGHKYATVILDMESGCILWLQAGKKKQVVYDFIAHVGLEWMSNVEAVSSDMNSDFEESFLEKCPHLKVVYDHFHIVKNFNDKVVSEVRKDEQRRLTDEGDTAAANALKGSKYILTSKRETLKAKDQDAKEGKVISRGSELFKKQEVKRMENSTVGICN
ncbi:MAG: transposase [Succinivibrio sp.]